MVKKISLMVLSFFLGTKISWAEHEIPRKVLAFYDSKTISDPFFTPLHQRVEIWLNHLGLELVFRPLSESLPSEEEMSEFRGVITWYPRMNVVSDPKSYCSWMNEQMKRGRKVVILGQLGFLQKEGKLILPECENMLQTLGLHYESEFSDNPFFFEIVKKDSSLVEFERKLDLTENLTYHLVRAQQGASVFLKIKRRDLSNSVSDMVFVTGQGGYVHEGYIQYRNSGLGKMHWRIHPLKFLSQAFKMKGLPRPDVTTVNGRRIAYSQIDGDGIFNVSHLDQKSYAGEIIYDDILKKYSEFPFSVSLITGYLDMNPYHNQRSLQMYRNLLGASNVEPASHGYAHPLIWKKGTLALHIPGYTYQAEKEVAGSVTMMNDLMRQLGLSKKARLFQWTGNALPTEEAMISADRAGLLNINGGGGRLDHQYDSYSFLYPLSRVVAGHRQIYSSFSNENIYTNQWGGPYYGFVDVLESFWKTENPIRIKPINIYFHYYSGERVASLRALETIFQKVLSQPIFPMFAGDYSQIVSGFFQGHMEGIPGGFRLWNFGALRTIRFDDESRSIDLARSKGVLGFQHFQGSLYIFLDENKEHRFYWSHSVPERPYLDNASISMKEFSANRKKIHFLKQGWYQSEIVLGGVLPRSRYQINSGKDVFQERSNNQGFLRIHFEHTENSGLYQPVTITLESQQN